MLSLAASKGLYHGGPPVPSPGRAHPYPTDVLPTTSRHGPSFEGRFFWPRGTTSWAQFVSLLFFSGDGLFTISLFCILFIVLYRLFGSPLETVQDDKRIERDELWEVHRKRFTTESGEHFVGGGRYVGKGGGASSDRELEEKRKKRAQLFERIRVETVSISMGDGAGEVQVTVVGDRSKSTLSVITHHDVCTNFRHGLLPFSVELLAELQCCEVENGVREKNGVKASSQTSFPPGMSGSSLHKESICFYHISAPGHIEGETSDVTEELGGVRNWTMDSLASRMNRIISCLDITGRCIFLGEGAGANICLRAASEEASRALSQLRGKKILISGVALVCCDSRAPTVGNHYTSMFGATLLRRRWGLSTILGIFGVPKNMLSDAGYMSSMESLNTSNILSFASAFYTGGMRTRIKRGRTKSLANVPNLVLCPENSAMAKEKAKLVCEILDQSQGSGVVAVPTKADIGSRYVAGGGALLNDQTGRSACLDAVKLFLEAAL